MAENQANQGELFEQEKRCARCTKLADDPTRKLCTTCNKELQDTINRKRQAAKASGMCIRCYKLPAIEGKRNCTDCNEKENTRSKEKTERARRFKRCIACGKEPEPGRKKCTECLAKFVAGHAKWRENKKSKKQCYFCGKDNDRFPKVYCSVCAGKGRLKRLRDKMDAFNAYGGPICKCCGESILEFLSIDHVNNDGAEHRRQVSRDGEGYHKRSKGWSKKWLGRGVAIYAWLKRNNYPEGFQVLCMNCNFAKGKFGYCPHKVTAVSLRDGEGI